MNRLKYFLLILIFGLSDPLLGDETPPSKNLSPNKLKKLNEHNKNASQNFQPQQRSSEKLRKPYLEYEKAKYLLFSAKTYWASAEIKDAIAKNLPEDVTLVVITHRHSDIPSVFEHYHQWLPEDRLIVFEAPKAGGFWSRDALPIPIYELSKTKFGFTQDLHLVDARYYHAIEPDERVASQFDRPLQSHNYYFEGGNFLSDSKGNCFIVNRSYVQNMPDELFYELYGCTSLHRFPHDKGIGHIDESVKFLSDSIALTDHAPYRSVLEEMGYEVHLLPRPEGHYETYVNSLLVNGTLFIPTFGHQNDEIAIKLYESFGFNVIALDSKELSKGKGSIHCITMAYPEEYKEFLEIES